MAQAGELFQCHEGKEGNLVGAAPWESPRRFCVHAVSLRARECKSTASVLYVVLEDNHMVGKGQYEASSVQIVC